MTGDDKAMTTKLTHYLHVVIESLVLERKHRFRIVMAIYNITNWKEVPTAGNVDQTRHIKIFH